MMEPVGLANSQQGCPGNDESPVCIESRNSRRCNKVGPYGGEEPFGL